MVAVALLLADIVDTILIKSTAIAEKRRSHVSERKKVVCGSKWVCRVRMVVSNLSLLLTLLDVPRLLCDAIT